MKKSLTILGLNLLLCFALSAQTKIIFDTDFGGDADDLGALAMLHTYITQEKAELLGVVSWSTEQYAVSGIDAVNTFYGRGDIPIGMREAGVYHEEWNHSKPITEQLPFNITPDNAVPSTILYRQLLSEADDNSVTIVTVGPLANILALMQSKPDDLSELNGLELIYTKVKEFVIMGGQYPAGEWEWNFNGNMPGITKAVIEQLGVPTTFLGYEVGLAIKTGEVFNQIKTTHPLYIGYRHFSEFAPWINENFEGEILDNASYDQTAVLYAVEGGIGIWWERKFGVCLPDEKGGNKWLEKKNSSQNYLKLLTEPKMLAEIIETRMLGD